MGSVRVLPTMSILVASPNSQVLRAKELGIGMMYHVSGHSIAVAPDLGIPDPTFLVLYYSGTLASATIDHWPSHQMTIRILAAPNQLIPLAYSKDCSAPASSVCSVLCIGSHHSQISEPVDLRRCSPREYASDLTQDRTSRTEVRLRMPSSRVYPRNAQRYASASRMPSGNPYIDIHLPSLSEDPERLHRVYHPIL
jgi:hypothetical protein